MTFKNHIFKIWIGTFGDKANRTWGHVIESNTQSQFVHMKSFPIGWGRFVGVLYIKNNW